MARRIPFLVATDQLCPFWGLSPPMPDFPACDGLDLELQLSEAYGGEILVMCLLILSQNI